MPVKKNIKFEKDDIYYVNGVPWPRLPEAFERFTEVPLQEDYSFQSMDYLDTPQARPIFDTQADYIIENGYKNIVDIGCRHGPVLDILYERGYNIDRYMGFDTSLEPIEYAQKVWEEFDNIEFKCQSWKYLEKIAVGFKPDCLIWSGVLLYAEDNHMALFDRLHTFYQAPNAIIQEPCTIQREDKWLDNLELHTIEDQLYLYEDKYHKYEDKVVDCEIFSGRRKIVHITL